MNIKLPFNKLLILRAPRLPKIIFTKIPNYAVYGLTNRTEDNMYLLFADYDNVEDTIVYQDIKMLQAKFGLGTCLIRTSNHKYHKSNNAIVGSFHIIFFTKLPFKVMKDILQYLRCDANFKKANFQQRVKVLRLSRKGDKTTPRYYQLITARTKLQCSYAHGLFFEEQDKIPIIKYLNNLDKSTGIELINYLTA